MHVLQKYFSSYPICHGLCLGNDWVDEIKIVKQKRKFLVCFQDRENFSLFKTVKVYIDYKDFGNHTLKTNSAVGKITAQIFLPRIVESQAVFWYVCEAAHFQSVTKEEIVKQISLRLNILGYVKIPFYRKCFSMRPVMFNRKN